MWRNHFTTAQNKQHILSMELKLLTHRNYESSCVCVCVHARTRVCTYVRIITFKLNGSQPMFDKKKGVPCMYNKHLLSTNQLRSINNWLTLIIHTQMILCTVHKHANNAMIGAHINYNCASFTLTLILTCTTSNILHFNYLIP